MKVKDFLREIATTGEIRDNDFEAALGASALAEVEIPDTIKDKFNQAFLTRARAKADPEIVTGIRKEIRSEIFNNVDERLKPLYEFVDDETKLVITPDKTFETYKRLEMLKDGIEKGIKAKGSKVQSEDLRKIEDEWNNKVKGISETHKQEIESLKKQHKDERVTFAFKQEINKFKVADAFLGVKDQISDSIINKVRNYTHNGNKTSVELGEDGTLHVRQNVDGSLRDIFDGNNNKLTVESLLTKELEPFIVKSNGKDDKGKGGNGDEKKKIVLGANPTLHELMQASTS